ncbi:MAG TPA: hypothetical protein DDW30_07670 [Clostridiales bacterium]|nr:hypothetical protein [Clostridiales bacterium]
MKTRFGKPLAGAVAFCMVLVTVLAIPFGFIFSTFAADADYITFSSGAVLITPEHNGKNILIQNGVFSVTVSGATGVTLLFDGVTMDRRYSQDTEGGNQIDGLWDVSSALGWGTKAQVCPLLITNASEVKVAFRGTNYFYAGVNGCTVTSGDVYTKSQSGGGFAGIQVDSGSTLTIEQSNGSVFAYGGHYVAANNSSNNPSDSTHFPQGGEDRGYGSPAGTTNNKLAGGAGIGGGVSGTTTTSDGRGYVQGTPGTIIINGGEIHAYGGHEAAGIGGGVNGAATSTSITVNGGTIEAYGGRWAAGIGDGDSLPDNPSNQFSTSYSVNITGGKVTTVGGVGCAGIGCTDNEDNSGMTINLTGGSITAHSGYPDGFNPSDGTYRSGQSLTESDPTPAGIGAGNKSKMAAQSIIIKEGTEIIAASFGHYSITENGLNQNQVPNISLAQCRMYNGRFPNLVSTDERTFRLLEAQREEIDVDGVVGEYIKFITQPEGGTGGTVYYYDSDRLVLLNADKTLHPLSDDISERRAELLALFEENNMTLYADDTSIEISTVIARKHFKSIAITLPDPLEHGGVYALEIPTSQILNPPEGVTLPNEIYITITALTMGNIWGEIDYPFHYNMKLDAVSASFEKLDVYPNADSAGGNGLIGAKYSESLFAYTVYIEHDATEAYLYAAFLIEKGEKYTIKLGNVEQEVLTTTATVEGETVTLGYVLINISMVNTTQKVLELEKQDSSDTVTAHSIIYKITINRKATYSLSLKDLSKTYDGNSVVPSVEAVLNGSEQVTVPAEDLKSATFTYGKGTTSGLTEAPKDAGSYTVTATINTETYTATGTASFTIFKKQLTVSRIEKYLLYVKSSEYEKWKGQGTYKISDPGAIFLSGLVKNESVTLTHGDVYYNNLSIGYSATKITLDDVQISGDAAKNYTIEPTQTVFGQINYSLVGTIFRSEDGEKWDKFYPIDSPEPVGSASADYHSPTDENGKYTLHAEYVWARTQGGGEAQAVYAMEIEFGAMYFNYTKEVWNTDSMKYEKAENNQSYWVGFNGINNCVTVVNRSNADIVCNVKPEISFIYASHDGGESGIVAKVYTKNEASADSLVEESTEITVSKATPPETVMGKGEATRQSFYLFLSGNPQSGNTENYIAVGDMIVTVKKKSTD